MMTGKPPFDLVLFVSGEPGPGDAPIQYRTFAETVGSLIVPPILLLPDSPERPRPGQARRRSEPAPAGSSTPAPEREPEWHLPREAIPPVELVLKMAQVNGRVVTLINANAPGPARELVERWVGPGDLLPVLVGPDGHRLVGLEMFTPRSLRRFLAR